jgi:uncharacterized membrane protein SpoIIM required for sporulation
MPTVVAYTNIPAFVSAHRKEWEALDQAVVAFNRQRGPQNASELEALHELYLKVTQHLSFCQTYFPHVQTTAYLNELAVRAHNTLYRDQITSRQQIKTFFSHTFLRLLVERWKFIAVSCLLFMLGGLAGFISVLTEPLNFYALLPQEITAGIDPSRLGQYEYAINSAEISAFIMTNNIQVAILAFAGGATLGLLSVYILLFNGLIIGALAAVFWQFGYFYEFWAFIVPHGMIELVAIFIAGSSGLLMGYKVLVPGTYPRIYQLKKQAFESAQLLLGTLPLFVLAGLIEGFITPVAIPLEAKYAVAGLTVLGLFLYIYLGSRKKVTVHTA